MGLVGLSNLRLVLLSRMLGQDGQHCLYRWAICWVAAGIDQPQNTVSINDEVTAQLMRITPMLAL